MGNPSLPTAQGSPAGVREVVPAGKAGQAPLSLLLSRRFHLCFLEHFSLEQC